MTDPSGLVFKIYYSPEPWHVHWVHEPRKCKACDFLDILYLERKINSLKSTASAETLGHLRERMTLLEEAFRVYWRAKK